MTPKALIFDVDGTLAETEEAHRHAFNDVFAEFAIGWHWGRDLYRELLRTTGGKERMRAYAANHLHIDPAQIPVVEIHRRKTQIYGDLIAKGTVPLRPGIAALIKSAQKNGCRLAVATTTNLPNVDRLIRATLGLPAGEVFEVIAAGDMVKAKKPAPDVYALALARLDLPARDCLALEDSRNGLASAQAAAIPCVICPSAYTDHDDFTGAIAVLDSFEHISQCADLAALFAPA
ncbi:MAG: HAD superfamily hydrolase (TIGR01509 family) [Paracoccaceae bacterium]|jgi:HAD superfamily hydrolase (TIGR01509 family)